MNTLPESPRTAFPATEAALRASLAGVGLNRASFLRPLAACSLAHCRGTCCTEGVYLNPEVAAVLRDVVRRNEDLFKELGLDLSRPLIVAEAEGRVTHHRTALYPRPFHGRVDGYPPHFHDTACSFLLEDGRCALQSLAIARGLHPWHFKPLACWLHPISITASGVELPDELSDPYREGDGGGFSSQTFCGRTEPCGRPAHQVLRPELDFLGAILGRDLLAEPAPTAA